MVMLVKKRKRRPSASTPTPDSLHHSSRMIMDMTVDSDDAAEVKNPQTPIPADDIEMGDQESNQSSDEHNDDDNGDDDDDVSNHYASDSNSDSESYEDLNNVVIDHVLRYFAVDGAYPSKQPAHERHSLSSSFSSRHPLSAIACVHGVAAAQLAGEVNQSLLECLAEELHAATGAIKHRIRILRMKHLAEKEENDDETSTVALSSSSSNSSASSSAPFVYESSDPSVIDSYRKIFCRRCFIYDCGKHEPDQPKAQRELPIVKQEGGEEIMKGMATSNTTSWSRRCSRGDCFSCSCHHHSIQTECSGNREIPASLESDACMNPLLSSVITGTAAAAPDLSGDSLATTSFLPIHINRDVTTACSSDCFMYMREFSHMLSTTAAATTKGTSKSTRPFTSLAQTQLSPAVSASSCSSVWSATEERLLHMLFFVSTSVLNLEPVAPSPPHIPSILPEIFHQGQTLVTPQTTTANNNAATKKVNSSSFIHSAELLSALTAPLFCRLASLLGTRTCREVAEYVLSHPSLLSHGGKHFAAVRQVRNELSMSATPYTTSNRSSTTPSPLPADHSYSLSRSALFEKAAIIRHKLLPYLLIFILVVMNQVKHHVMSDAHV